MTAQSGRAQAAETSFACSGLTASHKLFEVVLVRAVMRRAIASARQHDFNNRDLIMSNERRTIPVVRQTASAAKDCPLAPPEHASVHARALHRACLILGGIRQLAERLEATEVD